MNMQQKLRMLELLNEMQSIILNENSQFDEAEKGKNEVNGIKTPLEALEEEERRALEGLGPQNEYTHPAFSKG